MRKFLYIIILSIFLTAGETKPAHAIVIDPGQIAGKISDYVEKITDAINMGIQEVNKVKQMATQGFNFQGLLDAAMNYGVSFLTNNLLANRNKEIEGGTQAQNKRILEMDRDNYKEAATELYKAQIKDITSQEDKVAAELNSTKNELASEKQAETSAKNAYENEEDPAEKDKKFDEYMKHSSKITELNNNVGELETLQKQLQEQKSNLNKELQKVENNEDEKYKSLDARVQAMETETNGFVGVEDVGSEEWDTVDIEKYMMSEETYKQFVNQYFYDTDKLDNSGSKDINAHQSRMDRIMRQRRYLIVNSAAHLMQVAASIRRELPSYYERNKEMYSTIGQDEGELAAVNVYSSTRIESARALLLYAKLLCAKLQYESARDLLKADVEKTIEGVNLMEFDLGKYILREEDVNALKSKFSYGKSVEEDRKDINSKYYSDEIPAFLGSEHK